MNAESFISQKLDFKGKLAVSAIAVSFLVIIIAVAVAAGFRKEIRRGVTDLTGDIQLTGSSFSYFSEEQSISSEPSYMDRLRSVDGVEEIVPVIYRAGIVRHGDDIQGVIVKGIPSSDTASLQVSIPSRLAKTMQLAPGDDMLTYFVGDRLKLRRFHVKEVYQELVSDDDNLMVYASLEDMRRLNGWEGDAVSAMEVSLENRYKGAAASREKAAEMGSLALAYAHDGDDIMVSAAAADKYAALFDWLDLIDFNVVAILILMTVVAGFNMISGLLIMLFRNISTIGTLKSMGMTDKGVAGVFSRVASRIVLKGMLVGNAAALLFCLVQGTTHLIPLNPENYFLSYVPVGVNIPFIILTDAAAYIIIMLLLRLPMTFITKVDPARTVRSR